MNWITFLSIIAVICSAYLIVVMKRASPESKSLVASSLFITLLIQIVILSLQWNKEPTAGGIALGGWSEVKDEKMRSRIIAFLGGKESDVVSYNASIQGGAYRLESADGQKSDLVREADGTITRL
jgi:hypothetical protein